MLRFGVAPNEASLNLLMDTAARSSFHDEAWDILEAGLGALKGPRDGVRCRYDVIICIGKSISLKRYVYISMYHPCLEDRLS